MLIEFKNTTGYPQKFQTSYAKNNSERIFNIGKKLDESDMNKGVTLAFQTMSSIAAENVGRSNISITHYTHLMKMYNAARIPTYTELILGLPGETYESFASGINQLIKAGQHHSIYIHNCEWLPCSTMGSREYVDKYKISTTFIPLNQPHMESPKGDEIPEYSQIVTETYSMNNNMWIEMNMLSYAVQCFHHMNLLQFFAIYLFNEKAIEYVKKHNGFFDKKKLFENMKIAIDKAKSLNLQLYCGEFGCLPTVDRTIRLQYYTDIIALFKENDIAYTAWDYKGDFGIRGWDRKTLKTLEPDTELIAILLGK